VGRSIQLCAVFLVALAAAAPSQAAIEVTYTADNVVGGFYRNGGDWGEFTLGSNAADWKKADTHTISDNLPGLHSLIFRVANLDGPSSTNPAGFLAQIKVGPVGDPDLFLSDASWQYALDTGGDPPSDFDDLTWANTTVWSHNVPQSGDSTIWYANNSSKPITGIHNDAAWIWSENNFDSNTDQNLWIHVTFEASTLNPIPEPASVAIWSMIAMAFVCGTSMVRRRRRFTTGGGAPQGWSPENRMAIQHIVERGRHG